MTKQCLNRLGVRTLTNEEARQRVAQIVVAPADLVALFEHSGGDCSRPQVVCDQHVCDARLLALHAEACKYPVSCSSVGGLCVPHLQVGGEYWTAGDRRLRSRALWTTNLPTCPSLTYLNHPPVEVHIAAPCWSRQLERCAFGGYQFWFRCS